MMYWERLRDYYQDKWSGKGKGKKTEMPTEVRKRLSLRKDLRKYISEPDQNQLRVQMSLNVEGENCLWLLSTTRYDALLQLLSRPGYSPLLSVQKLTSRKRARDEEGTSAVATDRICSLPPVLQGSRGLTRLNFLLGVLLGQRLPSKQEAQEQVQTFLSPAAELDLGSEDSLVSLERFWGEELQSQSLSEMKRKLHEWINGHTPKNPCVKACLEMKERGTRLFYVRPHLRPGEVICWRGFHHTKSSSLSATSSSSSSSPNHISLVGFHHAMNRTAVRSDLLERQWKERLECPFEFGAGSPASRDVDLELQYGQTMPAYKECVAKLTPLQKRWWGCSDQPEDTDLGVQELEKEEYVELVDRAMKDLQEVGWTVFRLPVPTQHLSVLLGEVLQYMRWLFLQGNGTRKQELQLYPDNLQHSDFQIFHGSEKVAEQLLGHPKGLCRKGYNTSQSGCGLWNRYGMVNLYGLRSWMELQMHPVLMLFSARLHGCRVEDLFWVPERLRIKRKEEDGLPTHSDRNLLH